MEFENLITLIKAVSDSNLTQFSYEEEGFAIKMKTDKGQPKVAVIPSVPQAGAAPEIVNAVQTSAVSGAPASQEQERSDGNVVKSPLVGTFYAGPSPDEEPFVKVGDAVSKGQVLGIVEAMKLMNEIESDYDGVVKEILVADGDVIEFGQPMFVIG